MKHEDKLEIIDQVLDELETMEERLLELGLHEVVDEICQTIIRIENLYPEL